MIPYPSQDASDRSNTVPCLRYSSLTLQDVLVICADKTECPDLVIQKDGEHNSLPMLGQACPSRHPRLAKLLDITNQPSAVPSIHIVALVPVDAAIYVSNDQIGCLD